MRKTIMTTIGALFAMAIAVLGASVAFDNTPTAEARLRNQTWCGI